MLSEKLAEISREITQIIENDSFSTKIHPDFLKKAVLEYPCRGGKRLRPALLLWSCGLLNGDINSAKFAAAAVEIYHNWTLVHDDIIDDDDLRRGKPSVHSYLANFAENKYALNSEDSTDFGRNFAILAGDIQQGWAVHMLLRSLESGVDSELVTKLVNHLQELVNRRLISGEGLDVLYSCMKPAKISSGRIQDMISMKTGALLRFCAECGASIALKSSNFADSEIKKLGDFAENAGIAFQLKDDWLGIFGDERKLGKPICSDIREGKNTILLAETLERANPSAKSRILELSARDKLSSSDIEEIKNIVHDCGAGAEILKKSGYFLEKAEKQLCHFKNNSYRKLMFELLNYLVEREF